MTTMQPFTATKNLLTITKMNEPVRRATALYDKCNAAGECPDSPTHILIYRKTSGRT